MKNAPTVSPAHVNPALGGIVPPSCRPELKMYWSGVPFGQNPPPTTGELFGSTHTSPMLLMPQNCRFTFMTPNVRAKRFRPDRFVGRPGAGFASAGLTPTTAASTAAATTARPARVNQVGRISYPSRIVSCWGRRPVCGAAPAIRMLLEVQLEAD